MVKSWTTAFSRCSPSDLLRGKSKTSRIPSLTDSSAAGGLCSSTYARIRSGLHLLNLRVWMYALGTYKKSRDGTNTYLLPAHPKLSIRLRSQWVSVVIVPLPRILTLFIAAQVARYQASSRSRIKRDPV